MTTLLLIVLSSLIPAQVPPELPADLAFLKEVTADEAQLVKAMRDFDVKQTQTASQELDEVGYLKSIEQPEQAQLKMSQAQQRLAHVRTGYEYVLAHYRSNALAHTYYGELLYDYFGAHDGALRAWQLANSLDPKLGRPLNNLGLHYCHIGMYEQGLEALDTALELEPKNPDYLFNVTQIYLVHFPQVQKIRKWDKQKVYCQAMKLSKKAADYAPEDYELLQDYAVNFFAGEEVFDIRPDWKKAAKAWQRARPFARNNDETFYTWLNEGRVWLRDGNKKKAAQCFERGLALKPNSEVAQKLLTQTQQSNEVSEVPKKLPTTNIANPSVTK